MKKTILLLFGLCVSILMQAKAPSYNNALEFDGMNTNVTAALATDATDNITLEAWVKWNGITPDANGQIIILNGSSSSSGYTLYLNQWEGAPANIGVMCGGNAVVLTSQTLTVGTWTHLAAVRGNGTWNIYINGESQSVDNNRQWPNTPTTGTFIGVDNNNAMHFNGSIDEVRIWTEARSQSQIVFDMSGPVINPNSISSLVTYYNFNTGTPSGNNSGLATLYDLSSYGKNASLYNFNLFGDIANWVNGFYYSNLAVSKNIATIDSTNGSQTTVDVSTLANWSVTSDQTWLTTASSNSSGSGRLTLTATGNGASDARTATVTISATGLTSQTITVTQKGTTTFTIASKAGKFYTKMSTFDKQNCTKLIVTDTIDARDFVTFRDSLPNLDTLDLSAVKIVAYSGDFGTDTYNWSGITDYNANAIPQYAFYNEGTYQGSYLTSILLPNTLTKIGNYSFYYCNNIHYIEIPASITSFDDDAFEECSNLDSIKFEANSQLTSIGSYTFYGCTNLSTIRIPSLVTNIGSWAFGQCTNLYVLPFEANSNLTSIGDDAFYNCINLLSITFPASVTTISYWAFEECHSLYSISFEATPKLSSINDNVFYNCYSLTNFTIPSSVTSISSEAFYYAGLQSITIPSSVTSIGSRAFIGCSSLSRINAMSITPIDLSSSSDVFNGVDKINCSLNVLYGSKTAYQAANQWQDFNTITEVLPLSNTMDASATVVDQNETNVFGVTNVSDLGFGQYLRFKPVTSGTYSISSDYVDCSIAILNENGTLIDEKNNPHFSVALTAGNVYYMRVINSVRDGIAINVSITGGDLQGFVYSNSESNLWDGTSNWNWGVMPEAHNNVTVKGDLLISHDISVTNFTVSPNASVTVEDGLNLLYTNLTLVNDTTGSASFISDNTNLTATVKGYLKSGRNWYISSPTTASTSNVVITNASNKLWNYDESTTTWNEIANNATALSVMTGYVANIATDGFISFTEGVLNTGTKSISLNKTGTGEKSGFNLIGNPYPSCVDWNAAQLSNIDSTIWYRTQNKNNVYVFDTYNAANGVGTNNNGNAEVTQYIAPLQAVWVKVNDNFTNGTITFNNDARTHSADRLKSGKAKNRIVRLQVSNGQNNDETILTFNDNASDSVDGYDSPKMFVNNPSVPEIYSAVGKKKCVINGMKSIDSTKVIHLGFKAAKKGKYTISATEITGIDGTTVVLEDKLLSKTQDLTSIPTYTFESDSVNDTARFVIHLKSGAETTATTIEPVSEINIYSVGNTAIVSTSVENANGTVTVFDILGQTIASAKITGTKTDIELPAVTAAYFVKVETEKVVETKKIVVE